MKDGGDVFLSSLLLLGIEEEEEELSGNWVSVIEEEGRRCK